MEKSGKSILYEYSNSNVVPSCGNLGKMVESGMKLLLIDRFG